MRISLRSLSLVALPCMAAFLLATATQARADSVTGSVWEGGTTGSVPAAGASVYTTTPTATFTLTNSTSSLLDFYSYDDASLTTFLTHNQTVSNGDTLTFLSGASHANDGINNDLFEFKGSTTLAVGTYTFGHDDGLIFYLDGTAVITEGGPTPLETEHFHVCAAPGTGCDAVAGTYSYVLDYAEVSGAPAALITDLPLTSPSATPEPGSFILLGSGLLGMAGIVRRRFKA